MNIPAHHLAGNRSNASELDDYSTPEYATITLLAREKFEGVIWECACGSGRMSSVIEEFYPGKVVISDIILGLDFLKDKRKVENIVTNPPYKLAEEFVRHSLECATGKVAMFLRLNFLESQRRYRLFRETPLRVVYVFCKRQALSPPGIVVTTGGTIAYAWFVWDKSYAGKPFLDWIND